MDTTIIKFSKKIIFFLFFSLINTVYAQEKIHVAVIDTGMDLKDPRFSEVLCKTGHKNFTSEPWEDSHPHGVHVAGIIKKYAKDANYCLLIYKVFTNTGETKNISNAFYEASYNKGKVINFSGGGENYNEDEEVFFKIHQKIILITAAGNNGKNIDDPENTYFPAFLSKFLKNIIVVGNINEYNIKTPNSNYGKLVKHWEIGHQYSTLPDGEMGWLDGSSMSTAVATGKYIYENFR